MSYQELTANIATLKAQIAKLEGTTQLHSFYTAKVTKLETAAAKMTPQGMEEEIVDPYPDYATFRAAIMPGLIITIGNYLDGYMNKTISQRGNISYTKAFTDFLGIVDINDNWESSFRSNSTIDAYLQTIFTQYQSQLTAMSIGKYTKAVSTNIWFDFVIRGSSTAQSEITEADLGATNPYNYNLVDNLDGVPKKLMPKRFRVTIVNYQNSMLTNEPEGYQRFTKEWGSTINRIKSYINTSTSNEGMSKDEIKQNIRNMFNAVNTLVQQGKYFTEDDYLQLEDITVIGNPENGIPAVAGKDKNKKGNNTSNSTDWIFNPEYVKVPPINIPEEISRFNGLSIPFVPAPNLPSDMSDSELDKWLADNEILDGEIPVGSLDNVRNELSTIALFLNRNTSETITITGQSNYGSGDGRDRIPRQIGLARADKIKSILTDFFGVNGSQINTIGVVGSPIGIIISQP